MEESDNIALLTRIADALERLAPAPAENASFNDHPAYHWDGHTLVAINNFEPVALELLTAVDDQKERLLDNTQRHASGFAAHDALLWGSRGMGKSAITKAVVHSLQQDGSEIAIIQIAADHLATLPALFAILSATKRPFILFIDDIGFEEDSVAPRLLRSMLEGGAAARPSTVRLYVTSNRRHIVARQMAEQNDQVNPRDALDDKLALSDRFGLRLGFHAASQEGYLAMISKYASTYDLSFDGDDALLWSSQHGSRSGRVAWQYVVEIAGRAGKFLS